MKPRKSKDLIKCFKVKTTSIDYAVTEEDVCWQFDDDPNITEDMEEYDRLIQKEIKRIKDGLPQHLELEVECEPDDLEWVVADAISEQTGWLINGFTFKKIK